MNKEKHQRLLKSTKHTTLCWLVLNIPVAPIPLIGIIICWARGDMESMKLLLIML